MVVPSALPVTVMEQGDVHRVELIVATEPEDPIHHLIGVATSVVPLNARPRNVAVPPSGRMSAVSAGARISRVARPGATPSDGGGSVVVSGGAVVVSGVDAVSAGGGGGGEPGAP